MDNNSMVLAADAAQRNALLQKPAAVLTNTREGVAAATEAQALGTQFLQSSYQAITNCKSNEKVAVVAMETRMLNSQENKIPQFDIVNADAADQKVIIGSLLGLTGAYGFFGQPASGVDNANMSDQYGNTMRALQGFTNLCNHTPVIVTIFQLISSNSIQVNQPLLYNDLAYDSTITTIRMNTSSTFTRYDTLNTIVKMAGLWALGPQSYLSINSKAGQSMSLSFTMNATSSVKSFRMIQ